MKNNKLIKTIKQTNKLEQPISLISYQKYEGNFTLVKLINNYQEVLFNLDIKILELNSSDEILRESIYHFDKLDAGSKEEFVLPAKLKIGSTNNKIQVEIINAKFETNEIIDGVLKNSNVIEVKEEVDAAKTIVNRVTFTRSNKPIVFAFFTTIILMALLIVNIFNARNKYFETHSEFEYIVLLDGSLEITKYNGVSYHVEIPSTLDGRSVTSIGTYAFFNSKIKTITIYSNELIIKPEAFKSATKLKEFNANHISSIGIEAFSYATSLRKFDVRSVGIVNSYAFEHTNKLKRVNAFESGNVVFKHNALAFSNLEHYLTKEN